MGNQEAARKGALLRARIWQAHRRNSGAWDSGCGKPDGCLNPRSASWAPAMKFAVWAPAS